MSFTFAEQQTKLSQLLGDSNTSSDDMFPLADRKAAINRGEIRFARDTRMLQNYATGTVSDSQLAVPSDWIETFNLVINNKNIDNKREIALKDWERYQSSASSDTPYYYMWRFSGTRLLKFLDNSGVNGMTYKWWYFAKPTTLLSGDSDTSVFEEEYRSASVFSAAAELMLQIGKAEQAREYLARYDDKGKLIDGYLYYVEMGKKDVEKTFIDKTTPTPDLSADSVIGGYSQGDGGYRGY